MSPVDRETLITDWIAMHHLPEASDEYASHAWAERKLCEIGRTDPNLALDIIVTIVVRDQTDRVLSNLAAGPLEDLLSEHGEQLFDRVAALAEKNERFKKLLGGVWQGDMSDELWQRVSALSPDRW